MAVYILADIHGMYDKFIRMLDKINMTDEDILYVLGDMVDRGPHPIKVHTSDEGKLVPVSKASLQALIDKVAELGIEPSEQVMFICHADCEVEARAVAEEMKARYGVKEVYINYIGPVIGSHTGPNTMGIFFVGTKR